MFNIAYKIFCITVETHFKFIFIVCIISCYKTNICRIMHAAWTADERGVLCFTIRANRFLRNMVRSLVGTLVDVGRGRYTPGEFRAIVESRDLSRSSAGVPAQGLFLSDVRYPPEIFEPQCYTKFKLL